MQAHVHALEPVQQAVMMILIWLDKAGVPAVWHCAEKQD